MDDEWIQITAAEPEATVYRTGRWTWQWSVSAGLLEYAHGFALTERSAERAARRALRREMRQRQWRDAARIIGEDR